jgi:dihydrofolate reductase
MQISIIVAVAENGVIGRGGELPWRLSADLQRFKRLTMGHTIIMGRRTWDSIGRALPGRRTIIITRQVGYPITDANVAVADSLESAFEAAVRNGETEAFIVGGAEIYQLALPHSDRLYITRVHATVDGDTRFPDVTWSDWQLLETVDRDADEKNDYACTFEVLARRNAV